MWCNGLVALLWAGLIKKTGPGNHYVTSQSDADACQDSISQYLGPCIQNELGCNCTLSAVINWPAACEQLYYYYYILGGPT